MSYLREQVSYLKGLADGMQISETSNEGKLLSSIIDVIDDITLSIEDIEEIQDELTDTVDDIDQDLAEIESIIFDQDDYDEDYEQDEVMGNAKHKHFNFHPDMCDCGFPHELDDEDYGDEEVFCEVECPHCNGIIATDKTMFDEEGKNIECPFCHNKIEVEWICDCEDCQDQDDECDVIEFGDNCDDNHDDGK